MIQVRHKVFETNSSSSHSFSIASGDIATYDTIVPDDGVITLVPEGEFGWGQEEYNDPHTKAAYCWLDILYIPNQLERSRYKFMLFKVLTSHTGAKDVIFAGDDSPRDEYGWFTESTGVGYIDHQSVGNARNYVFINESILKDFIFNPKSTLIIDNDNH